MAQGLTLEQLQKMGAKPVSVSPTPQTTTPKGQGLSLEQLQSMGAKPVSQETSSTPTEPVKQKGVFGKVASFASDVFKSATKPVVTLAARPIQAIQALAGATPEQQDMNLPYYGEIKAPRNAGDVAKDVGRAVQTVTLGIPTAGATKVATTGAKALGLGTKVAPVAAKIATGAAQGYAFDVGTGLESGEGAGAFKPGMGTVFGAAIPATGAAASEAKKYVKGQAPRIINSLIRPLAKDFSYGKNPGRAIANEGIVANSFEDLVTKVGEARKKTGIAIGKLHKRLSGGVVDGADVLKPIDDAIEEAAKKNQTSVITRLRDVREALTSNLTSVESESGKKYIQTLQKMASNAAKRKDTRMVAELTEQIRNAQTKGIVNLGQRDLAKLGFDDAFSLKTKIGDMTQFTGNPSDDKAVNAALKRVYGNVKERITKTSRKMNSAVARRLEKLNEKYADFTSAEVAAKNREKIIERQNLIGFNARNIGVGATVATAILSGGAALPSILIGLSAAGLEKAFETPAVKTRIASFLASQSQSQLQKLYAANPALRDVAKKLFVQRVSNFGRPPTD